MNGENKLYLRVGSYKLHRLLVKILNSIFIAHGIKLAHSIKKLYFLLISNRKLVRLKLVCSVRKMIVLHSGGQPMASNR